MIVAKVRQKIFKDILHTEKRYTINLVGDRIKFLWGGVFVWIELYLNY